ncbi:MAG: Fic family protein [Cytophagaceae bacterium]|nr:MAG: Fic family protein [Cytophagaceae bacterium]
MKPPYDVTASILKSVTSISEKIGEINAKYLTKQSPTLRKQNQIKTIHSSLKIEGNTLTEAQITALIENKPVVGPQKDIREVINAIEVYNRLASFNFTSEKDFLTAHQTLLQGLLEKPGSYRTQGVGIVTNSQVKHVAPPFANVPYLMKEVFAYLKDKDELTFIKGCVFHYEMEFIHPFLDGNGRMGRLWQTVILRHEYPVFEFLPFESLISQNQAAYYQALAKSDKQGKATSFIEYMLGIIDKSLATLLLQTTKKLTDTERTALFLRTAVPEFTRKEYRQKFPELSSATASRDLKKAVDNGLLEKFGDKKTTRYRKPRA